MNARLKDALGRAARRVATCAGALVLALMLYVGVARAQHPIDIERLHTSGEHFRAMVAFERLPSRRTTVAAQMAAAQSAWALGLLARASELFDGVLRSREIDESQRARITLSRAMIELQREEAPRAALFAERVVRMLPDPGPLRGQAFAVWAHALKLQGEGGKACERFSHAREEVSADYKPEITFELARCLERIGRAQEAVEWYQQIPLSFDRAAEGLRSLVTLALDRGDHQQAEFWIKKGKELFPTPFMESWVALADARIAIGNNDAATALSVLTAAEERFPPSDSSLQLMRAEVEQFLWQVRAAPLSGSSRREEGSR